LPPSSLGVDASELLAERGDGPGVTMNSGPDLRSAAVELTCDAAQVLWVAAHKEVGLS
jgi:hypothetical protein